MLRERQLGQKHSMLIHMVYVNNLQEKKKVERICPYVCSQKG